MATQTPEAAYSSPTAVRSVGRGRKPAPQTSQRNSASGDPVRPCATHSIHERGRHVWDSKIDASTRRRMARAPTAVGWGRTIADSRRSLGATGLYGGQKEKDDSAASDANILNSALGGEFGAVVAYQLAADSGLLQKPVLDLAMQFQGQHKAHAELLTKTVKTLGGQPAEPKQTADYKFPIETLKTQTDVLRFAAGLEQGAASGYLGMIPVLGDRDLAKAVASILGDEAMHWAILRQALGENPVPEPFIS